jgi:hypothetical protein
MMKGMKPLRIAFAILAAVTFVAILWAGGSAALRFPHTIHKDVADCNTCHSGATTSKSGKDNLIPQKSVCIDCHTDEDLGNYGWTGPRTISHDIPKFSHAQHLAMEGVDCDRCHGALNDTMMVGTAKGSIGHPVCFACHDGKTAPKECEACHSDMSRLRPLDHDTDYMHTHQFAARGSAGRCEECHRQSESCGECHYGENVLFPSHPRNYAYTHAQDARKHENDCVSCHSNETFCNDCHASEGIRPTNHDNQWTSGANHHAAEAKRDIQYCAACHQEDEPVCVRCHQDRAPGKGNDRSIHPGNFDQYGVHGPWHDDSSYYCYDCHRRSTAPDGFCGYCHSPNRED